MTDAAPGCREVEDRGLIELYLVDRLEEADREAFERHYFACDRCFTALQRALTVRDGFEAGASRTSSTSPKADASPPEPEVVAAQRAGATGGSPPLIGAPRRPRRGVGAALTAAAIVAVVVAAIMVDRRGPGVDPALALLGAVGSDDMPRWEPARLRGPAVDDLDDFLRGMEAYANGDWAGAAESLAAATERRPDAAAPRLYLGASLLALGRPADAISHLELASAQPLLADESRWLLAKGHLQRGDASAALEALESIPADSPLGLRARALEEKVQALRTGG